VPVERHDTIIIGGGQAGLAMSYQLRERGRQHLLIERDRLGGKWHSERWDSLYFQFPNWALSLPGHRYNGDDPEGFSHYSKVIDFLDAYARLVDPPLRHADVVRVSRSDAGLRLETSAGDIEARNVVVATGAFPSPFIPSFAERISPEIVQLHSSAYRRPDQLPPGGVLVVGSGSSGGQIAEELQVSGRDVFLSVSRHQKFPRRMLGKDMLWWLYELGRIDRTIDDMPHRRPPPALLVSGIDGGHDLDVRKFAADGMTLLGRAIGADGDVLLLEDNLHTMLAEIDAGFDRLRAEVFDHARTHGMALDEDEPPAWPDPPLLGDRLDLRAAGIRSIVWCTGYRPAFGWIDIPVFDAGGAPVQQRGTTACPGLYFLGLHWMHSLKSGALFGVGDDAGFIADRIHAKH
jgi:putative flavoprotein involved in K+ transport